MAALAPECLLRSPMTTTRPLTEDEMNLARWMLENGTSEASMYVDQLLRAEATSWRCSCGCASFNFKIRDLPEAPPGVQILGDYLVGDDAHLYGAFIFQSGGILSGVELYGLAGDAPKIIPMPNELRRFDETPPNA